MSKLSWSACLACLALHLACMAPRASEQPTPTQPALLDMPDALTDPALLGPDFVWRQKLSAGYGDDNFEFEAVLEKSGNALRVLFLTPYGSRALLLEQLGQQVTTKYFVSQRLPFPARYILGDIHRVFFRGFAGTPPSSGTHTQELAGEVFRDTWHQGMLVSRSVELVPTPAKDEPRGHPSIAIRYTPGYRAGSVPGKVFLNNPRRGYKITIETLPD